MLGRLLLDGIEHDLNILEGSDVNKGLKGIPNFNKICLLKFGIISPVCISTIDMNFNIDIIFLQNNIVTSK
jgi:hypothetical protein